MWLVTTQGFYSAVAHRTSADHVIVRTRTREDIEALRRQIPEIEPSRILTPTTATAPWSPAPSG